MHWMQILTSTRRGQALSCKRVSSGRNSSSETMHARTQALAKNKERVLFASEMLLIHLPNWRDCNWFNNLSVNWRSDSNIQRFLYSSFCPNEQSTHSMDYKSYIGGDLGPRLLQDWENTPIWHNGGPKQTLPSVPHSPSASDWVTHMMGRDGLRKLAPHLIWCLRQLPKFT